MTEQVRSDRPERDLGRPADEPRTNLVPGDDAYHDDKQLIADLASLNGNVGRFVLRYLDTDAGRAVSTSPADEMALGECMVRLGEAVQARAERRQRARLTNGSVVEPAELAYVNRPFSASC